MTDFETRLQEYCSIVEKELNNILNRCDANKQVLFDAMSYSVDAGGKRIRPVLLLEFNRICGGKMEDALPFACAMEMIHTYSLIHDDLPCMDDDDMRRGKPSCHKAFGEANALLAGDALLNLAFETMLSARGDISPDLKIKAASAIGRFSGAEGMIGGQVIDLQNEGKEISEELLLTLYRDKTAGLLRAASTVGVILAGGSSEMINAADSFAEKLGLAFQIIDDILDCIGDEKLLGKPIGSDDKNNKTTFVTFHGIDGAKKRALELTRGAVSALDVFNDTTFLTQLSDYLCTRKM